MTRAAFGPNLRRARLARGISLETIARETRIPADLWDEMERNDFARWPTGVYARAHIREYARLVGVDPEATVDDFCRWFPQGDRRAERIVRGHAEIVGHELQWQDQVREGGVSEDRRAPQPEAPPPPSPSPLMSAIGRLTRALRAVRRARREPASYTRTS